jgi:hypothetical protein
MVTSRSRRSIDERIRQLGWRVLWLIAMVSFRTWTSASPSDLAAVDASLDERASTYVDAPILRRTRTACRRVLRLDSR